MARLKGPDRNRRAASARACLTKTEYAALGRHARLQGKTISTFVRDVVLDALSAEPTHELRSAAR